jgi:hypothetical protein
MKLTDNLEWCTNKENNQHRLNVLGYKHSEEVKKRIRESSIEAAKKLRKPVKCLEDNMCFESIQAAANHYGVNYNTIGVLLKNKSKSRHGKSFAFVS